MGRIRVVKLVVDPDGVDVRNGSSIPIVFGLDIEDWRRISSSGTQYGLRRRFRDAAQCWTQAGYDGK